jgi:hypothetical protein
LPDSIPCCAERKRHDDTSPSEVNMTHDRDLALQRSCRRTIVHGVVALALVAALAPWAFAQKITTEFDETVDFSRFKTFDVREGQLNSGSPALNSELTKKRLEMEIQRALTARGLTRASGRADLNVFFSLGAQRRVETETYPAGWRGLRTRVARVPHAEGTLVIDLRDPTTRSLVWRGIATEEEPNPAKLSEKLDDMVRKSFAKYPPRR